MTCTIRRLGDGDAEAWTTLRKEALAGHPLAFGASPETDFSADEEKVRELLGAESGSVVFGAFEGDRLAGTAGLYRDRHGKAAHKLWFWGMYVAPEWRGRGIGRALLDAAIEHARSAGAEWLELSVTSDAPEARRLYERAGFESWGTEPDALRHEGRSVSETNMSCRLKGGTGLLSS